MEFPAKRKHAESPTSREPEKVHAISIRISIRIISIASSASASSASASSASASASASTENESDPTKNIFEKFMFKQDNRDLEIEKMEKAVNGNSNKISIQILQGNYR